MKPTWFVHFLLLAGVVFGCAPASSTPQAAPREVLFWHFWGGKEQAVVEEVVRRFNARQQQHVVRAVAMPGNNLDLKLFLAITGGAPPDLVNQDDPILADWAARGAILPLSEFVPATELRTLESWLFPAAWSLAAYQDTAYGLCNGLDVRALLYNQTVLDTYGLSPPETLEQLDQLAETITPAGTTEIRRMAFFPKPRNLWAWGIVFNGQFYDPATGQITLDQPGVVRALRWMASYGARYGDAAVSFRTRDQSLPGQAFPLVSGRYVAVVDGQWRVNDIRAAQAAQRRRGEPVTNYGVAPLPIPPNGRPRAGWINGNFFVVPRGSQNPEGAWEFMKFWSGCDGYAAEAAQTAIEGGWIPVSQQVIDQPAFQRYLQAHPLFAEFIQLAGSPNQTPRPNILAAARLDREVRAVAEAAMFDNDADPQSLLEQATTRLNKNLDLLRATVETSD